MITPPAPTRLTVNDLIDPVAVEGAPRFGWWLGGAIEQASYQIQVTTAAAPEGALVWDSGHVPSAAQSHLPYAGPALEPGDHYRWVVRIRDRQGQLSGWSRPGVFGAGLTAEAWEASWIRRAGYGEDEYALLRREVLVPNRPVARAVAYIAAYHSYELRLGGDVVSTGPAFAFPDEGYYKAIDVGDWIEPGQQLAIGCVLHTYGPGKGRPDAEPGLLFQLAVDFADETTGPRPLVLSDGSWKVARGPWLPAPWRNTVGRDYVERVDGTAAPVEWDRVGFDDGGWEAPEVIGRHPVPQFPRLSAQEPGLTRTMITPVDIDEFQGEVRRHTIADFGKIHAAVPVVTFSDGIPGHLVPIRAAYLRGARNEVATRTGTQVTDLSFEYVQRGGEQVFRPHTYVGFRYLQIDHPGFALEPDAIRAIAQHTDVDLGQEVTVSCDQPMVEQVVQLALHSALHCSQEQMLDTPTREKGQFLGDTVNISRTLMLGYGERALTRKAITEFVRSHHRWWPDGRLNALYPTANGKRDIPDFTLMFPGWLWDYYLQSGDATTLEGVYPVLNAISRYAARYRSDVTGLVTNLAGGDDPKQGGRSGPYSGGVVDNSMRSDYDMAAPARTTVNVWAIDTLEQTANAAQALGRPDRETHKIRATAEGLRQAVNQHLRRKDDDLYIDGLHADGSPSPNASQMANVYPLAFGLVPEDGRDAVADHVAAQGMRMGPMHAHLLVHALHVACRFDDAVRVLTDITRPGWANVIDRGGTFLWENWEAMDPDADAAGASLSHGWGAAVLVPIIQDLLGVRVTAPGAASVTVEPPQSGLTHASGVVPTQRGPLEVRWWREGDETCLDLSVPSNQRAAITLPGELGHHEEVGSGAWSFRPRS